MISAGPDPRPVGASPCAAGGAAGAGRAAWWIAQAMGLVLLGVGLAGCPRFHPGPVPGAPPGARFAVVDGVRLRYQDQGRGPAVVLLHGFAATLEEWGGVAPALAATHRVVSLDLKGFGWSSRPDGDYSPQAEATLVWHLLDQLGVHDVAVVGHSWGAGVALSMVLDQPGRVRRIALYDAYVFDDEVPSFFRWAGTPLGPLLFALEYRQRVEDRIPLGLYDPRIIEQRHVDWVERQLALPGTVAAALAVARSQDYGPLEARYRTIRQPVLLLWGAADGVTPVDFARRLLSELPDARLIVYPRCGHSPMAEAAVPSTRDLARFLDDPPHFSNIRRTVLDGTKAHGRSPSASAHVAPEGTPR